MTLMASAIYEKSLGTMWEGRVIVTLTFLDDGLPVLLAETGVEVGEWLDSLFFFTRKKDGFLVFYFVNGTVAILLTQDY